MNRGASGPVLPRQRQQEKERQNQRVTKSYPHRNRCTTLSRGGSDLDENGGSRFGGNQQVLLRGIISDLTKHRASYETIFTEADKQAMERTAIVAALAGLNDIALNLSTSTQFTDTVGDLVTFTLNGEMVRAWIWLSVFENGDEVEVVAERAGAAWIGYAIRRRSDGILSVHPHCERGSRALIKSFIKWSVLFWSACALVPTFF
ncbi:putative type VI secretion system effector [Burkholderia pseudomallei]|uniref:putative type VI secretion system effector n=1 Tax=Burkholderia pseudomallei TaxID=28450 RepID=UPI003002CF78